MKKYKEKIEIVYSHDKTGYSGYIHIKNYLLGAGKTFKNKESLKKCLLKNLAECVDFSLKRESNK